MDLSELRKYTNREGSDGSGRELGEVEMLSLHLLADREGALALKLVGGNGSNTLANSVVRILLELTAFGNRNPVGFESFGDLSVLGARENSSDDCNLLSLLEGEGEPVLLLSSHFGLRSKGNGGMEEGRGSSNDDAVRAESINSGLSELDSSSEIGLPDVATGDKAQGEDDGGVLDGRNNLTELTRSTVKVDVKTGDREFGNEVDVGVEASKVSGKHDLRGNGNELGVGSGVLLLEGSSSVKNQDGLINLDPFNTSSLQISKKLFVDRDEFGQEGDGTEPRLSRLGVLAENEERDGAKYNRASDSASLLGFLELLQGLVVVELELGFLGEFGDDIVVVGVKPE